MPKIKDMSDGEIRDLVHDLVGEKEQDKEGEKRHIIQLLQSRCKHTRCEWLPKASVILCLDCGKLIYTGR